MTDQQRRAAIAQLVRRLQQPVSEAEARVKLDALVRLIGNPRPWKRKSLPGQTAAEVR